MFNTAFDAVSFLFSKAFTFARCFVFWNQYGGIIALVGEDSYFLCPLIYVEGSRL
jgi:hypothetical protein